jgi:anti-sigma factor ChrR (cupin superfamily)
LKSRFVGKLAELAFSAGGWEPFRDGIEIKRLWGDPRAGASVALLRYQPGARGPRHRHGGFEVIYVVSGSQSDERGTYVAGSLVVNPEGDEHHVRSDEGCVVLLIWERPVEFV